jgi:hypothetical protein
MKSTHWRERALLDTPKKLDFALEELRAHGDIGLAADKAGLDGKHLRLLALYEGDDAGLLDWALAFDMAQAEGKGNQANYAKRIFLASLSRHASVVEAVASQRWYSRSWFDTERVKDPAFDADWAEAVETAVDKLRLEAWRRGAEGVDEPVTYQGEFCYEIDRDTGERRRVVVRKYSDGLLTTLLKRYDPAFRERQGIDLSASVEGGLTQDAAVKALGQLSVEELAVLNKLVDSADGPESE